MFYPCCILDYLLSFVQVVYLQTWSNAVRVLIVSVIYQIIVCLFNFQLFLINIPM